MDKKVKLNFKGKKFELVLKVCNFFERFIGLMFSRREKAKALLFDFKKPSKIKIHSWFVFFPFVAVWLDDKNEVVDLKIVRTFNFGISPNKSFSKLIEIPVNKKYYPVVNLLCPRFHSF